LANVHTLLEVKLNATGAYHKILLLYIHSSHSFKHYSSQFQKGKKFTKEIIYSVITLKNVLLMYTSISTQLQISSKYINGHLHNQQYLRFHDMLPVELLKQKYIYKVLCCQAEMSL